MSLFWIVIRQLAEIEAMVFEFYFPQILYVDCWVLLIIIRNYKFLM
jgi:hypothetical protein